jgi:signal recognition particle subunit SRP54
MLGQDAVNTAQAFLDGVGFDGVVLTKLDGDARGGAALSVASLTGRQIMFASTGEKLEDFDTFHPERMASRILGMGDILTLIEQTQSAYNAGEAEETARKLTEGELTLEDFLEQMMMLRKMGPIGNLLGMLPGMGQMKEQIAQVDDKDVDRIAAIIRSMTPTEREDPKIINGSRRVRIAKGSGVTVAEVNSLVDRFFEARKMMKQMAGMGGLPGMGARRATKAVKKGKKGKGGRPGGRPGGAPPAALPPGLARSLPGGDGGLGLPAQLPPGMKMPDLSKFRFPPTGGPGGPGNQGPAGPRPR